MVLNLFYEASTRTRSSFELAAKRLSADVVNFAASGSSVEKGESLKDTVLTLSAHKPDAIVLRTPWAGAVRAGLEMVRRRDRERGRRQARASDAGAARRLHAAAAPRRDRRRVDLDRRRRRPFQGRAVEHHRVSEDGREGDGRRATDADPARDRGARLRGALHARRPCQGRRGVRAADAARADERELPAVAARVCRLVPDQRPAAGAAPGADAPRAGQPRRGALRRGRRLAPGCDHRPGRGRRGGEDGGPLRAARRFGDATEGSVSGPAGAREPSPTPADRPENVKQLA